jgi:hypothetical protein
MPFRPGERACGRNWFSGAGVKRLHRVEMTRRGITYEELTRRLASIGVQDTAVNLRYKVARGRLSQCSLSNDSELSAPERCGSTKMPISYSFAADHKRAQSH